MQGMREPRFGVLRQAQDGERLRPPREGASLPLVFSEELTSSRAKARGPQVGRSLTVWKGREAIADTDQPRVFLP
jgi:hypothetical protein